MAEKNGPHRKAAYVSGLVSLALLQYLTATNDTSVLTELQYRDVLSGIAGYYYKRIAPVNEGKRYGLLGER